MVLPLASCGRISSAVAKSDCNGRSTAWRNLDLSRKGDIHTAAGTVMGLREWGSPSESPKNISKLSIISRKTLRN